MAWINWKEVTAAKDDGGVGIGSIGAMNSALLYKWRWRALQNPDSLWAQVISSIHGLNCFANLSFSVKGLWSKIVSAIKSVHSISTFNSDLVKKEIGNGRNTLFWKDKWIGNKTLADSFPRLFALETDKECNINDRVHDQSWSWAWRHTISSGRVQVQLETMLKLLPSSLQLTDTEDYWTWSCNGHNTFSVAHLRKFIDHNLIQLGNKQKTRWINLVPKKNIERGKTYKLVVYIRSLNSINVTVSLTESTGVQTLATTNIIATDVANWKKMEVALEAKATNHNSRLELKTNTKGVIWFDQVSLMSMDAYKGHGYRNDLYKMVADLKPGYIRFPGGSFVEGIYLRNAYNWKDTVGPWEERPGHFGDKWNYWTDDGLGHFEFLQLAEDLGASPIWVLNSGLSEQEAVDPSNITPFVQDSLDGIEFARGDPNSTWGSVRSEMGHTEPFNLKHVAIGNQDCGRSNYRANYLKFYTAIKKAYPDIKVISNCDGSNTQLDHPAEMYDYHVYASANDMFSQAHKFDLTSRIGPKAFVSEYAVTGKDAGSGSLLAALAEAGFLIGVEKNSDVVDMASNAPLFVNANYDKKWMPDAIVFDSYRTYGTPSYWMQRFFSMSNGATLVNSTLQTNSSINSVMASTIWFKNPVDKNNYLRVKVVNYGSKRVNLNIGFQGLDPDHLIDYSGSSKTVLSSTNVMDENSFQNPTKVSPVRSSLKTSRNNINAILSPKSFSSFDLLMLPEYLTKINAINDMSYVSLI